MARVNAISDLLTKPFFKGVGDTSNHETRAPVDRRAEPRMIGLGNAFIRVGLQDVSLVNWSRGGFAAIDKGYVVPGQIATFRVHIRRIQERSSYLDIHVEAVILSVENGVVRGRWQGRTPMDRQALRAFAEEKSMETRWLCPNRRSGSFH